MKHIEVVAAIIHETDKILATQRGSGDFAGMWEFPGGKIEPGETAEQAIVREIQEELEVEIVPEEFLVTVEHTYPTFHLTMHCFIASTASGAPIHLLEHSAAKWVSPDELDCVDWLPADVKVVDALRVYLAKHPIT